MVDIHRKPGRFVILGSASPALLRQSTESLAGRISYIEMMPLSLLEIDQTESWEDLWILEDFLKYFFIPMQNLRAIGIEILSQVISIVICLNMDYLPIQE